MVAEARASVRRYYAAKVRAFGPTPHGVDWPDALTQHLRLLKLIRIADDPPSYSWNDLGCGYGALLELIEARYGSRNLDYVGIDLCPEMIAHARRRWRRWTGVRFAVGERCDRVADYTVASGIFNVQFDDCDDRWEELIRATLREMFDASRLGAAVNFKLAVAGRKPGGRRLYATSPGRWLPFCCDTLGAEVETVSGYAMAEFSILLRKRI